MKVMILASWIFFGSVAAFGHELDVYDRIALDAASKFVQIGKRQDRNLTKQMQMVSSDILESIEGGGQVNRQRYEIVYQSLRIQVDIVDGRVVAIRSLE